LARYKRQKEQAMKILKPVCIAVVSLFIAGAGSAWAEGTEAATPAASIPAAKPKPAKKLKSKLRAQAKTVNLSVTDEGFVPADLKLKKGVSYNLVVTRQTDKTCATQIEIPGCGPAKDLPLNVPVSIVLEPKTAGEIRYSCGMGMLHGVLSIE
jgi:hypothetical protein